MSAFWLGYYSITMQDVTKGGGAQQVKSIQDFSALFLTPNSDSTITSKYKS